MLIQRVGLCMLVAGASAVVTSCGGVPSEPREIVHVRSPSFSNVESMVIQSDLVLVGTVEQVTPGRKVGPDQDELQYRDVQVRVDDMLFSRLGAPVASVVVQEIGWINGKPVEPEDWAWSKEGDRAYFFLQKDVDGKFGYLGPQAHVKIEGGELVSSGTHEAPAVAAVNAMAPEILSTRIGAAAVKIENEDIPNPPGPAMGDGGAR